MSYNVVKMLQELWPKNPKKPSGLLAAKDKFPPYEGKHKDSGIYTYIYIIFFLTGRKKTDKQLRYRKAL